MIWLNLRCNFIEITLRDGCSPVNLLHIVSALFAKNTSRWLLQTYAFYEIYQNRTFFLQISMGDNSFFPSEAASWICYVVFTRLCSMTWNERSLGDNLSVFRPRSRSSHRGCSITKGVLKNFVKFTGNHLYLYLSLWILRNF